MARLGGLLLALALAGAIGACDQAGDQALVRAEAPTTTAEVRAVVAASTPTSTSTTTPTPASTSTTTSAPRPATTRAALAATTTPPTAAAAVPAASGQCHPSYVGACLPLHAVDVDCAGGTGNGPVYVSEKRFRVVGPDVYGLDSDGNGIACER